MHIRENFVESRLPDVHSDETDLLAGVRDAQGKIGCDVRLALTRDRRGDLDDPGIRKVLDVRAQHPEGL